MNSTNNADDKSHLIIPRLIGGIAILFFWSQIHNNLENNYAVDKILFALGQNEVIAAFNILTTGALGYIAFFVKKLAQIIILALAFCLAWVLLSRPPPAPIPEPTDPFACVQEDSGCQIDLLIPRPKGFLDKTEPKIRRGSWNISTGKWHFADDEELIATDAGTEIDIAGWMTVNNTKWGIITFKNNQNAANFSLAMHKYLLDWHGKNFHTPRDAICRKATTNPNCQIVDDFPIVTVDGEIFPRTNGKEPWWTYANEGIKAPARREFTVMATERRREDCGYILEDAETGGLFFAPDTPKKSVWAPPVWVSQHQKPSPICGDDKPYSLAESVLPSPVVEPPPAPPKPVDPNTPAEPDPEKKIPPPPEPPGYKGQQRAIISAHESVPLRSCGSTRCKILLHVQNGVAVEVIESTQYGWTKIRVGLLHGSSTLTGYVATSHLIDKHTDD